MSAEQTVNFGIPKESHETGIADARTFNKAMDLVDEILLSAQVTARDVKDSVDLATDAALPACTAVGEGVGKTLTADAVGVLTVDGVAVAINDRVLVKDQVAGKDNGIYLCTVEGAGAVAFVLTRAVDADTSAEVSAGMYTFVSEGTNNGDNGFSLTTDDPIVLDTDALSFTQVLGVSQILAGTGLTKSGNTVNAIGGNGITANADDLAVLPDPTPGSQSNPHLAVDAEGLRVAGLPPLFEIDDVAVGAGVISANLDTLTDGSIADALHKHEAAGLDGVTASGIHTGPICCKRIATAELMALLDSGTNDLFALETGDRILEIVFNVQTGAGATCTVDIGLDVVADGSTADPNGWVEAADANAAAPYSSTDPTYDGVYVLPGKAVAADGKVTITSSSDQSSSSFVGECYMIYMKG